MARHKSVSVSCWQHNPIPSNLLHFPLAVLSTRQHPQNAWYVFCQISTSKSRLPTVGFQEDTETATTDVNGSQFSGSRLPIPPKHLPHPFQLLSPDYQLSRAMEYFEKGEELIDEIAANPEWRSRPEFRFLVNDIGR